MVKKNETVLAKRFDWTKKDLFKKPVIEKKYPKMDGKNKESSKTRNFQKTFFN